MKHIGTRVKQRRKELGIDTQESLATATGISYATIQRLESGHVPKGDHLLQLAQVLKCSVDWLLTGLPPSASEKADCPEWSKNINDRNGLWGDTRIYETEHGKKAVTLYQGEKHPGETKKPESTKTEIPDWAPPADLDKFRFIPKAQAHLSAGGGAFVLNDNAIGPRHAFRREWLKQKGIQAENAVLLQVEGDSMIPSLQDGDIVMIDMGRRRVRDGQIFAIGIGETILVKRIFAMPGDLIFIKGDNTQDIPREVGQDDVRILGQVVWLAREMI